MARTIYAGATVDLWARFRIRSTNATFDPDVVRLVVRSPSNVTTTYVYGTDTEVTKQGTGYYVASIVLDAAGVWNWRWECDGDADGATQGTTTVVASNV